MTSIKFNFTISSPSISIENLLSDISLNLILSTSPINKFRKYQSRYLHFNRERKTLERTDFVQRSAKIVKNFNRKDTGNSQFHLLQWKFLPAFNKTFDSKVSEIGSNEYFSIKTKFTYRETKSSRFLKETRLFKLFPISSTPMSVKSLFQYSVDCINWIITFLCRDSEFSKSKEISILEQRPVLQYHQHYYQWIKVSPFSSVNYRPKESLRVCKEVRAPSFSPKPCSSMRSNVIQLSCWSCDFSYNLLSKTKAQAL